MSQPILKKDRADYDSFSSVVMRYSAVEENRFRIFYYICVLEMMFQWDLL